MPNIAAPGEAVNIGLSRPSGEIPAMVPGNEVFIPHIGWLNIPSDGKAAATIEEGWFDCQTQAFLWLYLRPGDCFIDWGCRSGLFSVLAAKRMESLGSIIARESGHRELECLHHNLKSHNVTIADVVDAESSRLAASASPYLECPDTPSSNIPPTVQATAPKRRETLREIRLMDRALAARGKDQAACIRLGHETFEVMETVGYGADIATGRTYLVMFGSSSLSGHRPSLEDLKTAWANAGFRFYRLDSHSLLLEPADPMDAGSLTNCFACADLEATQERLGSAGPKWRRIAQEILRRSQATVANYSIESGPQWSDSTVDKEELCNERLKLLRRARVERDLAEQRLDSLLGEWPIRLTFRAHVVRPPAWANRDRRIPRGDDPVSRHLAMHRLGQKARRGSERDVADASRRPDLSVILCTYNPRKDIIEWALDSVAGQNLDPARFEVILVDNNSTEPITNSSFKIAAHLPLRVVREGRQGLTYARIAGIRESRANLMVFVDDDNHLDADYFENSLTIAAQNPEIGLFGGIAEPKLEVPMAKWKERLLPYLGIRNHGDKPITSFETYWGEWEPIGAGMVARRDVAEAFTSFVENNPSAGGLGRTGQSLLSCEDSLFARIANRLDYACSYQPSLRLQHYMKADRLKSGYLFKLLEGMGRSYVRLERILGHDVAPMGKWKMRANLLKRMILRCGRYGPSGFLQLGWDLGYMRELSDGKRN